MSDDLRTFDLKLRTFGRKLVPDEVADVREALALEAIRGVVLMTPVDTGRARGNWQTTVGEPAEGWDESLTDKTGSGTISKGTEVVRDARRDPWRAIWLHNGVPYIRFLNDGTPKMRAVHMVEITVARLRAMFGGAR